MVKKEVKLFNKVRDMGFFFFSFIVIVFFLISVFFFLIRLINRLLSLINQPRFVVLIVLSAFIIIGILILIIFFRVVWYSFKFLIDKDVFTDKEFHKLRKGKRFYKKESSWKGVVSWDDFLPFFAFSLYFIVVINASPIWFYKRIRYIRKKAGEYEKEGYGCMFLWRKFWDAKKKDYDYYLYILPFKNKKK